VQGRQPEGLTEQVKAKLASWQAGKLASSQARKRAGMALEMMA
jgi:hypothetical protein